MKEIDETYVKIVNEAKEKSLNGNNIDFKTRKNLKDSVIVKKFAFTASMVIVGVALVNSKQFKNIVTNASLYVNENVERINEAHMEVAEELDNTNNDENYLQSKQDDYIKFAKEISMLSDMEAEREIYNYYNKHEKRDVDQVLATLSYITGDNYYDLKTYLTLRGYNSTEEFLNTYADKTENEEMKRGM